MISNVFPPLNCAAIILAAGRSSRMGFPKALLPASVGSLIEQLCHSFRAAGAARVIAVLGPEHAERIQREADLSGVCIVVNSDQSSPPLLSLQCGMRALPPETDAVFHTPVDVGELPPELLQRMLAAFNQRRPGIMIPIHQGRRGHPVLWRRDLAEELLTLSPDQSARDLQRRHSGQIYEFPAGHPAILGNLNQPRDLAENHADAARSRPQPLHEPLFSEEK